MNCHHCAASSAFAMLSSDSVSLTSSKALASCGSRITSVYSIICQYVIGTEVVA